MATQHQMTKTGILFTQADGFTALSSTVTGSPETTLFSDTLPAMSLMAVGKLTFRINLEGVTGAIAPTLTLRFKFGTAVLVLASAVQLAANVTASKPLLVFGRVMGLNSNNAQYAYGELHPSALLNVATATQTVSGLFTLDSTVAQTISVTAQYGSVTTGTTITPQVISIQLN